MRIHIVVLLLPILLVAGCVSQTATPSQEVAPTVPSIESTATLQNIDTFAATKEGDMVRFYFTFNDRVGHSGKVHVTVTDARNLTVYSATFIVNQDDFVDYQFKLTGNPIGKAYEWKIPFSAITKGYSSFGWGKGVIAFETIDGRILTAEDTTVPIPTFSEAEIKQLYEVDYSKSSKVINQTLTRGIFEVTLDRVGYFKLLNFNGEEELRFRADISVKNTGGQTESFSTYSAVLVQGSSQYKNTFENSFDGTDIFPGVVKKGYLLFDTELPSDLAGQITLRAGRASYVIDNFYVSYNYDFNFAFP